MTIAIIQAHGKDDYELDQIDLPEEVDDKLFLLVNEYCGCSERGDGEAITLAVKEMLNVA